MPWSIGTVELQEQLLATELVEALTTVKRIEIRARFNVKGEKVAGHTDAAHVAPDTSAKRHQDDRKGDRNAKSPIDHGVEAGIVLVVITAGVAAKSKNGKDAFEDFFKR